MFHKREIIRVYNALTWNVPNKNGVIDLPIGRSPINRKKMAIVNSGKPAKTKWKLIKSFSNVVSLLECTLDTGRTHQIRVHMSHLGNNLVGDQIYKYKISKKNKFSENQIHNINTCKNFLRQALHSSKMSFIHPINKSLLEFKADFPCDMEKLIKNLI